MPMTEPALTSRHLAGKQAPWPVWEEGSYQGRLGLFWHYQGAQVSA